MGSSHEHAASDVVATILIIACTVLMVAVVGACSLDLVKSVKKCNIVGISAQKDSGSHGIYTINSGSDISGLSALSVNIGSTTESWSGPYQVGKSYTTSHTVTGNPVTITATFNDGTKQVVYSDIRSSASGSGSATTTTTTSPTATTTTSSSTECSGVPDPLFESVNAYPSLSNANIIFTIPTSGTRSGANCNFQYTYRDTTGGADLGQYNTLYLSKTQHCAGSWSQIVDTIVPAGGSSTSTLVSTGTNDIGIIIYKASTDKFYKVYTGYFECT